MSVPEQDPQPPNETVLGNPQAFVATPPMTDGVSDPVSAQLSDAKVVAATNEPHPPIRTDSFFIGASSRHAGDSARPPSRNRDARPVAANTRCFGFRPSLRRSPFPSSREARRARRS